MGNFKPLTKRTKLHTGSTRSPRSIIRGTVGRNGENRPADLRLISTALSEAGLLSSNASQDQLKLAIVSAVRHIQRTLGQSIGAHGDQITPSDSTERAMRRAISELRFPTAHRAIALSTAPKGARALVECGMSIAKKQLHEGSQMEDIPTPFRRALLPPIKPATFQSNRRITETLMKYDIDGLDCLIAESIRQNGKAGFVEVRDFYTVLSSKNAHKAQFLASKVKRHLRGKPRRRFIKLIQHVPPNEDDFDESSS